MRSRIAIVLAAAAAVLAATPASAHNAAFDSTIQITGQVGTVVNDYQYYGEVSSPRDGCIPGRTVKIFALTTDGRKLVDTDRTSRNGFFFGGGDFTPGGVEGVDGVRVKVLAEDIGPQGHDHICEADTDQQGIA